MVRPVKTGYRLAQSPGLGRSERTLFRSFAMKMVKLMCVLACCAGLTLMTGGCKSEPKKAGSPGAVSDKACCTEKSGKECTDKSADKGSMGAVGQKSGCCSGEAKKTN
jgi:hypothetical protein